MEKSVHYRYNFKQGLSLFDSGWRLKMRNEKFERCIKMMRQLVSDIQGAPLPSVDLEPELYRIWFEHVQTAGMECLSYLDENFPLEKEDIDSTLNKFLK